MLPTQPRPTAPQVGPTADAERVRAAIGRLSPFERDLLVLRFRDDLPDAVIATATGRSEAIVARHLRHAAWAVQDAVGPTAAWFGEQDPALLRGRDPVLVEQEAVAGITPLLAARLAAAVGAGTSVPAADRRWRWHALLAEVRRHGEGAAAGLLVLATAVPTFAAMVS